jgi:hypothetical protein
MFRPRTTIFRCISMWNIKRIFKHNNYYVIIDVSIYFKNVFIYKCILTFAFLDSMRKDKRLHNIGPKKRKKY